MRRAALFLLLAAAAQPAHAFRAALLPAARPRLPVTAAPPPRRASDARMVGGFNGGFFNLGTPEVIVIGAVAWLVLGPKELFRLARQAGEFIGEWQQLGQQAKDQFTSAIEQELAEDAAEVNWSLAC